MGRKAMRRVCASLTHGLAIAHPSATGDLINALCRRLAERTGRPVHHTFVAFPPRTVSGLWVATQDADHILCERHTSPWHQLLITCHEMWHVLEDQSGGTDHSAALVGLEGTSLDDSALGRIMAARGPYDAQAEQDADLFASLLIAKLTRRVPTSAHGSSDVTMNRVERTLRGPGGVEPL